MAHIGQKAGFRTAAFLCQRLLDLHLLAALLQNPVDLEQNDQRKADERDLDEAGDAHRLADALHFLRDVIFRRRLVRTVGGGVAAVDLLCGMGQRLFGRLMHPDTGCEDNQSEQHDPCHDGMSHPAFLVLVQEYAEIQESEDAPDGQDQVGFHGKGADGQQVRHQKFQCAQQAAERDIVSDQPVKMAPSAAMPSRNVPEVPSAVFAAKNVGRDDFPAY